jgi:hypothetical protein
VLGTASKLLKFMQILLLISIDSEVYDVIGIPFVAASEDAAKKRTNLLTEPTGFGVLDPHTGAPAQRGVTEEPRDHSVARISDRVRQPTQSLGLSHADGHPESAASVLGDTRHQ